MSHTSALEIKEKIIIDPQRSSLLEGVWVLNWYMSRLAEHAMNATVAGFGDALVGADCVWLDSSPSSW